VVSLSKLLSRLRRRDHGLRGPGKRSHDEIVMSRGGQTESVSAAHSTKSHAYGVVVATALSRSLEGLRYGMSMGRESEIF